MNKKKLEREEEQRLEREQEQQQDGRGIGQSNEADLTRTNWLMVFGAVPTSVVKLDTKFVKNILEHVLASQNPLTKKAQLPGVFDQIRADDAKFEISVSNTIERLELYHRNSKHKATFKNEVAETIAYIFVNSKVKDLKFMKKSCSSEVNFKKAKGMTVKAYKQYYKVSDKNIHFVQDPTKEKVADTFEEIRQKATLFAQ